jgi:hypothetical protein
MPISPLRQRIKNQSLTPDIVAAGAGVSLPILDRTIDGPPGGASYARIESGWILWRELAIRLVRSLPSPCLIPGLGA